MKEPRFAINRGVGFSMIFKNGVRISVQFGTFHHCDNKDISAMSTDLTVKYYDKDGKPTDIHTCSNAEVAMFDDKGRWITREYKDEHDDVLSYVTSDEVAKMIEWASKYKQLK